MLGDERVARESIGENSQPKQREARILDFQFAVRANRQLAVALTEQGLSDYATAYTYRAQVLQLSVLWLQRSYGRWAFSLLLWLVAGYGYRLWRILLAYGSVVFAFSWLV